MLNKIKYGVAVIGASMPFALVASASEPSGTANTAVVTAMSSVAADMTATATSIIPVALTVVGISLVVVFGVRIFKRIAK